MLTVHAASVPAALHLRDGHDWAYGLYEPDEGERGVLEVRREHVLVEVRVVLVQAVRLLRQERELPLVAQAEQHGVNLLVRVVREDHAPLRQHLYVRTDLDGAGQDAVGQVIVHRGVGLKSAGKK